jgi:tetratricopeptide (TPR) repeat protein
MIRVWTPEELAIVPESRPFQSWSVCELLAQQSIEAAGDDPDRALELAELGHAVAENVPGAAAWRLRVRGYALFHVGNAWRVKDEFKLARTTVEQAQRLWEEGKLFDLGAFDRARVLNIQAALLRDERNLEESLRVFEEALQLPVTRERISILIGKSKTLEEMERYEAALDVLAATAEEIGAGEVQLLFVVCFNRAVLLCHLERFDDATALLTSLQASVNRDSPRLNQLRMTWLEGRIARGFGRNALAISIFTTVRQDFAARKMPYDQALVTLELAEVLTTEGKLDKVQQLTQELIPIFQDQGVHHEAARALQLFCESVKRQALTVELARQLVRYFYRARNNPALRF